MGDVGAATDPDVNSQFWNPAKYPFTISRAGVAVSYTPWLRKLVNDIDLAYLAGYYRIGDYQAVSGSLRYFSLGEVPVGYTGDENSPGYTIKPYEMAVDIAYSRMLSERFSARLHYGIFTPTWHTGKTKKFLPVPLLLPTLPSIIQITSYLPSVSACLSFG